MWTEVLKEILEGIDLETDVSIGLMGLLIISLARM